MSRPTSRPRRTRIYGANYDKGESLYKSALDDLDRKQYGRTTTDVPDIPVSTPRTRFNLGNDELDDDLMSARARAHRAITDEPNFFDSRGVRVGKGYPLSSAFVDNELDEDASISRLRAARQQKTTSLLNELDLDDSFASIKRRSNLDFGAKLMDIAGEDEIGSSIRSHALKAMNADDEGLGSSFRLRGRKMLDQIDDEDAGFAAKSLVTKFKRTTISDSNESAVPDSSATLRAKATKARLADIESDMFDRSEKQIQREKRAANLKKILADNDIEEVKSTKKVSF